jgi:septal ring factor EnvC (AmiA/AmiB activator)
MQTDLEDEILHETKRKQKLVADKAKVEEQLVETGENIANCEDRLKQTSIRSLELLKNLRDCEEEIDTLRQYIIDLKSRIAVYIPVRGDNIDKKLAEYINNFPERQKLKIMFMRESEGVY